MVLYMNTPDTQQCVNSADTCWASHVKECMSSLAGTKLVSANTVGNRM